MAGSWLPDDLRRKIEEEKYRSKNQKQTTTSSSSNGWFQNILDINNIIGNKFCENHRTFFFRQLDTKSNTITKLIDDQ